MKYYFLSFFIFCLSLTTSYASQGVLYYKSGVLDEAKILLKQELNSASKAEACYYLGNIYFTENLKDSAQFFFNEGLKSNPLYSQNSIGLLMLDLKSKDSKVMEKTIMDIVKDSKNKKNIDVAIAASYAYFFNGITDKAIVFQNLAKSINAKSPDLFLLKGDMMALTNLGEACANYETAILYDEKYTPAYFKYAKVYKKMNPKQAIDKLMSLQATNPEFKIIYRELGDIYYAMNDFANAAKNYEVYLNSGNSKNVSDLTKYSMTLFLNHEFEKSLEVAQLGIKKSPKNPAFNRLSMYNFVDLKKTDDALKAADLFFNNSENPDFTYLDYRYYGQALKDAKKFNMAVVQYKQALKFDSTKVELYKDLSDMYAEIDSFSNSVKSYQKYLSKLPEKQRATADNLLSLGKLYYSLGNDSTNSVNGKLAALTTADSLFAQVAVLEPEVYRANFWRARANAALDPETTKGLAKPFYEQTVAIVEPKKDPRYNAVLVECYSYLGYYTLLQKDNAGSIAYWNKILVINPNNATAKKAIAGIQTQKSK